MACVLMQCRPSMVFLFTCTRLHSCLDGRVATFVLVLVLVLVFSLVFSFVVVVVVFFVARTVAHR